MPLTLEQKKDVVAQVADIAQKASAAVAAEYRGLSVSALTRLREKARDADVHVRVVPNNLARRAFVDTAFSCMEERLTGPLILAFSLGEASDCARVMNDFAKENDNFIVKIAAYGGKLLEKEDIDALATLPTREQALAMLLSVMMAPVSKLVRTLAEPHGRLVRTLGAIRDRRQAS